MGFWSSRARHKHEFILTDRFLTPTTNSAIHLMLSPFSKAHNYQNYTKFAFMSFFYSWETIIPIDCTGSEVLLSSNSIISKMLIDLAAYTDENRNVDLTCPYGDRFIFNLIKITKRPELSIYQKQVNYSSQSKKSEDFVLKKNYHPCQNYWKIKTALRNNLGYYSIQTRVTCTKSMS